MEVPHWLLAGIYFVLFETAFWVIAAPAFRLGSMWVWIAVPGSIVLFGFFIKEAALEVREQIGVLFE